MRYYCRNGDMTLKMSHFQMLLGRLQNTIAPDPDELTVTDYQKLLELSNNQRKSYYRFLYKNQYDRIDKKVILVEIDQSWRLFKS